jgi:glutathione-specific gamma-glutamylcyclotransferase
MSDLWVFGYGSLMWRPGFAYEEVVPATLSGYRRCFCIYSVHHRGSPTRPGLVLGLDRGGICHGVAFRVAAVHAAGTLAYLRAREQVNGVYREASREIDLGQGRRVTGLMYIAERDHPSYTGRLSIDRQAALIRAAHGLSGTNLDYLANTLAHLEHLSIRERELERIMVCAGSVFVGRGSSHTRQSRIDGLVKSTGRHPVLAPLMKPGDRKRFGHRQLVKNAPT